MSERELLEVDVLVLGAGMAGLTAASVAAKGGASVLVVERAATSGGTSMLSSGFVWRFGSMEEYAAEDPKGNRELQSIIYDEFENLISHLEDVSGVTTPLIPVLDGWGHEADLGTYFARAIREVEKAGGQIVYGAVTDRLIVESGRVVGAVILDDSLEVEVRASATVLSTGGFAQSQKHLEEFFGPAGATLRARAAETVRGDGLDLARAAGARIVREGGFYGHLVGKNVELAEHSDAWHTYSNLRSWACWLYNRDGERFTDEKRGDHINSLALLSQPDSTGLLVWDEDINTRVPASKPVQPIDSFEKSLMLGALGKLCETPEAVAEFAKENGFAPPVLPADHGSAPFRALFVEPSITVPYPGIAIDTNAQVLSEVGEPIEGLYATGADCGGVNFEGYGGSLSLAGTTALRAVRKILAGVKV
ncbi:MULTISPECIES: FAD-dependent oxidoreductase [unclassified Rhodococcus (in: high G+C Gram-positive bacteria)]|uniref:FAD-dependent oxidoreductase n=1 Tax=unclassified Rhodococcus (in: high G+C Gram-positive bacteria) TaxID=192944 RepID=UPI00077A9168|nr:MULTISPECIES: FAD-dependent oxidoreductase [unclassified Rhodococcus (in: high G+C Gram-positive bacteria)]KXX57428.1 hypothetical protein AZG88_11505 [Rhodococcus sp. LB1]PBC57938.1 hypothetical protein CJ177_08860 [Rhodococcus sp. ACPA1]